MVIYYYPYNLSKRPGTLCPHAGCVPMTHKKCLYIDLFHFLTQCEWFIFHLSVMLDIHSDPQETHMKQVLFNVTTVLFSALLLFLGGCKSSEFEGLKGHWGGEIACYGVTSEINLSLSVDEDMFSGTAYIITKEVKSEWTVKGQSARSCDEDTCRTDRECPPRYTSEEGNANDLRKCILNPECEEKAKAAGSCGGSDAQVGGQCDPCQFCKNCRLCESCNPDWLPIHLTLSDIHVELPDPSLKLWRYSNTLLKGSIWNFCKNEETLIPEIKMEKE